MCRMGKWANGRFYMPGAIQFARPRSVTLPQDLCARRKWKKVDGVEWHGVVEISHLKLIVRHEWDLFEFRRSQRNAKKSRAHVNANVSLW